MTKLFDYNRGIFSGKRSEISSAFYQPDAQTLAGISQRTAAVKLLLRT
jgi:hypothetical protein